MLRVPRALNLMSSDIDLRPPVLQEMLSDGSRQNTLKMRIRVRKVLLNGKSNSNFACKYIYIPIFLNNLCREGWGLIAKIYVLITCNPNPII
jgi:hypothetical protein